MPRRPARIATEREGTRHAQLQHGLGSHRSTGQLRTLPTQHCKGEPDPGSYGSRQISLRGSNQPHAHKASASRTLAALPTKRQRRKALHPASDDDEPQLRRHRASSACASPQESSGGQLAFAPAPMRRKLISEGIIAAPYRLIIFSSMGYLLSDEEQRWSKLACAKKLCFLAAARLA